MKEIRKAERKPQFSPQAEALIRSRQQNPIYAKLRALLEKEEMARRGAILPEETEEGYPSDSLIKFMARLFS